MNGILENIYAVVVRRKNGTGSIQWSTVERNAVMRATEQIASPDIESVTVYEFDADDLIMDALDDRVNDQSLYPASELKPLHHFNAN